MKVSFLGLGIMGSRMAANLVQKGFEVTVWNRTSAVAAEFVHAHPEARAVETPQAAGAGASLVFTMVVDGSQVRELLLGERGAASGAAPGTTFIDCSTVGPEAAITLAGDLGSRGFDFLDAPVTGSSPRAQDGTLTFMVGGSPERFELARPALEAMGTTIVYAGAAGQGQVVKVINNAVAAANAVTLAQALLAGARQGADLRALIEVMASGSGASAMLALKAEPMLTHSYSVLFKLDHMLKDVRLALEALDGAGAGQAEFAAARQAEDVLARASELGFGDQDFAALLEALEDSYGQRL